MAQRGDDVAGSFLYGLARFRPQIAEPTLNHDQLMAVRNQYRAMPARFINQSSGIGRRRIGDRWRAESPEAAAVA